MSQADAQRGYRRAKGVAPIVCESTRGRLWDISRGGMAFSVSENFDRFPMGHDTEVTLKVPKTDENPTRIDLTIHGKIRNTRVEFSSGRLIVGIQFSDLSDKVREDLHRAILFFVNHSGALQEIDDIFDPKSKNREQDDSSGYDLSDVDTGPSSQYLLEVFSKAVRRIDQLPLSLQGDIAQLCKRLEAEVKDLYR